MHILKFLSKQNMEIKLYPPFGTSKIIKVLGLKFGEIFLSTRILGLKIRLGSLVSW